MFVRQYSIDVLIVWLQIGMVSQSCSALACLSSRALQILHRYFWKVANILNTQYSEYAVVESRYSFQTLIIYHGSLLPNQVLNKISYTKIHRCSFRQILLTKLRISIRQTSAQCRAAPAHKQSAVRCRMGFVLTTSRETYGISTPAAWISC